MLYTIWNADWRQALAECGEVEEAKETFNLGLELIIASGDLGDEYIQLFYLASGVVTVVFEDHGSLHEALAVDERIRQAGNYTTSANTGILFLSLK